MKVTNCLHLIVWFQKYMFKLLRGSNLSGNVFTDTMSIAKCPYITAVECFKSNNKKKFKSTSKYKMKILGPSLPHHPLSRKENDFLVFVSYALWSWMVWTN